MVPLVAPSFQEWQGRQREEWSRGRLGHGGSRRSQSPCGLITWDDEFEGWASIASFLLGKKPEEVHDDSKKGIAREAVVAGAGILASGGAASGAGVDLYDGQWHYSLTPYAWFPNISQTLQFTTPLGGGKTVEVEVEPDRYLSNLEFALMGTFEAVVWSERLLGQRLVIGVESA